MNRTLNKLFKCQVTHLLQIPVHKCNHQDLKRILSLQLKIPDHPIFIENHDSIIPMNLISFISTLTLLQYYLIKLLLLA
jgi:hypothetical protein